MKQVLIAIAALALSAPAAAERSRMVEVAGWTIVDGEYGCVIRAKYGQTGFSMGAASPQSVMVTLENPAWRSIVPGKPYAVTARFARQPARPVNAYGRHVGSEQTPAISFEMRGEAAAKFVRDFAASPGLFLDLNGAELETMRLDGTAAATVAYQSCLRNRAGADPFAEGS